MTDRILKDIRFYESEKQNIAGQSLPNELGEIFIPTKDTNYIGQRIARKLNELKFTYGEFDHIYINLTTILKEGEIIVSNRNIDKRIKYIDFGISSENLNSLSDSEKNNFIKSVTFKVLKQISSGSNLEVVNQTEKLIAEFDTEIKIHFKSKETTSFKIDIYYQIETVSGGTKAVIEYKDKKNNICSSVNYKLQFYEDIYTLMDTIGLTDSTIILKPKKSFTADISNERYETPITLKITDFKKCNCH
ncbi:hypothetical protein [Flavobacterium sp. 1355]|uniref:hypothetical protein n=1 Tax=Flavobacterium sp. 1355 TaxID=2806571 RepID=UPI001AEAD64D|nr:hypothetical protein [Flavobacterium sp. 1355]MBP1223110.1 hypothetical protein [Flavobacterium sp. 1355]